MTDSIVVIGKSELETLIQNSLRKVLNEQSKLSQKTEDEIFNINQAAKFLNLALPTIYGFTAKRAIPFYKRAKKLYFKKSDLEKWIMDGRRKTSSEIIAEVNNSHRLK